MCGIVGIMAFGEQDKGKEEIITRQRSMIFLGTEILQLTLQRGKDATGVSVLFDDGIYMGLKMGVQAPEFITRTGGTEKDYDGFLKVWRESKVAARIFLGHCRNGTKGDAIDNVNNHPIKVGEIVGVHNGKIENDSTIFEKLDCKRDGEVDSEAIFRLLHHYTKNGTEPFTAEMIQEVVHRLAGSFAVMTFSGNNPYQMAAFRDGRPLEIALIKELGIVICASEDKFIKQAIFRHNKMTSLYEADFPKIDESEVEFKVLPDDSSAIFDLRTQIEKDTEIGDLYEFDKMKRIKYWGTGGTTTTYNTGNKKVATVNAQTPKTKAKTGAGAGSKTDKGADTADDSVDDSEAGRIWSAADRAYKKEDLRGIEISRKMGNTEIDLEESSTTEIDKIETVDQDDGKGKLGLKASNEKSEDLIGDPAKVKEIKPSPAAKDGEAVEVDVAVDAEAMEAGEEAGNKEKRFEKVEEVLEALDIKDETTLKAIDVVALVNRISKKLFKTAFAKGYATGKKKTLDKDESAAAAQKNIRSIKAFSKVMLRLVALKGRDIGDDTLSRIVAESLENKEGMDSVCLNKLFKVGDERESIILKKIKRIVKAKEGR
jgi:hypothetical protein